MKRLLILALSVVALGACKHESIEDRIAREARAFTQKNCPTPVQNHMRTDSMVFDITTRTLTEYHTLTDVADNEDIINASKKKMHQSLLNALINTTHLQAYKDASINFRYVYHSASDPSKILYEDSFTKKDYGN